MVNGLFVMYNTLSCRYGDVTAYPSPAYAAQRIKEVFRQNPESLDEYELCQVGTIDIDTGVVNPVAPVRIPWSRSESLFGSGGEKS